MHPMFRLMPTVLLVAALSSQASPITRAEFVAGATNFNFTGLAIGALNVGDGDLAVSGGAVASISRGDLVSPTYFDNSDASKITLTWATGISAVGLDFNSNNADTTLFLYDAADNLLESLTVPLAAQTGCSGFRCGFVGIDFGSSLVFKAIIDTPLNGNELAVDNIIYQRVNGVPEPTSFALAGLALLGLGIGSRRRG